jgi:hypothetical protein
VSPALNVNLQKQKLNGLRRESFNRLDRRSRTRLAQNRGPSRWRVNVVCGRPVRSLQTRAQQRNGESLALCKHLVRFHREEDMRKSGDTAEEKCVEEGAGYMEVAGKEMEEEERVDDAMDDVEEEAR